MASNCVTTERASIVAELRQALGLDDSTHARYNLLGALSDLERVAGFKADEVCLKTIRRVIEQLADVELIVASTGFGEGGMK